MEIIMKKTTDIVPYENNPRRNTEAVKYVANSIKEFGFKQPIVIDKDGVIVAGHTRWLASRTLGLEEVPCIMADDLTAEQIKAYRLADNKVAELATWDYDALLEELGEISIDMTDFGFSLDDFEDEEETIETDDKDAKIEEKWTVLIDCVDEQEAQEKYDMLTEMGIICRVLTL